MKLILAITSISLAALSIAQADSPGKTPEQQLSLTIREVQTQQALMAENQSKIDAKLVAVAEAVRIARIYSSRAGH